MRELSFPVAGEAVPVHVTERPEDLREFMTWVRDQRGEVAVDSESQGLLIFSGPEFLRTVQFGTPDEAWVIPVEYGPAFRSAAADALRILPALIGHNWAGFDAQVFDRHLGVSLEELCAKGTDTRILAGLVDPRQPQEGGRGTGLKPLSNYYIDPDAADTQGDLTAVFRSLGLTKETGWRGIPIDHPTYLEYAGGDVILTSRLAPLLRAELDKLGVRPKLIQYEHELARICATMSRRGMVLDVPYTEAMRDRLMTEEADAKAVALSYGLENVNAPAQVAAALTAMGETLTETTAAGNPKADKNVLMAMADLDSKWRRVGTREPNPLADAIMHAKRAGKWRTAYADTFLETVDESGRIHPFINSMQARTSRMSITRPALQTLPGNDSMIRNAMLADEGEVIVSCDFQAVEMRVLAALADVKKMKHGFQHADEYPKELYPKGFDIHMYTARLVKGEGATAEDRKMFKGAGFGAVYGGGVETLARQTQAPEDDIRRAVSAYYREYPEIKRMSNRWQRQARETGLVHLSVTGRRLPLDRQRMYAVVNYACQSAARDVLGQSLLFLEEKGLLDNLRLPIHDEVLASVPAGEAAEYAREIERCMTFDLAGVPIVAEAEIGGRSWGSLYEHAA